MWLIVIDVFGVARGMCPQHPSSQDGCLWGLRRQYWFCTWLAYTFSPTCWHTWAFWATSCLWQWCHGRILSKTTCLVGRCGNGEANDKPVNHSIFVLVGEQHCTSPFGVYKLPNSNEIILSYRCNVLCPCEEMVFLRIILCCLAIWHQANRLAQVDIVAFAGLAPGQTHNENLA